MKPLTLDDLPAPAQFLKDRDAMRSHVIEVKARRRVAVGPLVSLVFENRETVRWQVLEMCRVEGIEEPERRLEELATYNEMIPAAGDLAATMFIELEGDAMLRKWLPRLSGLEEHASFRFRGREVRAEFEAGRSREKDTSCVHYLHFRFTDADRSTFRVAPEVLVGFDHPEYRHWATLSDATRDSLASDWA
jgi:hypothetical protein